MFGRRQVGTVLWGISHRLTDRTSVNFSLGVGATEAAPDVQATVRVPSASELTRGGAFLEGPAPFEQVLFQRPAEVAARHLQVAQLIYVCADDAHGTPIMLKARAEGIEPEELIARVRQEHEADFSEFLVGFDHYHSTHSDENRELAARIYTALRDAGHIETRTIDQAYDPEAGMFLPDRFIKAAARDAAPRSSTATPARPAARPTARWT